MSYSPHRYVTLARILRPRGTKGEVAAEILTDFPERLPELREVFLSDSKAAGKSAQEDDPRRVAVRQCWLSHSRGGQAIFHFEGCDSVAEAEKLRGIEVQIALADRVALPAGRYYISDLIGCEVFEVGGGEAAKSRLGVVADVQFTGADGSGTPLLVLEIPPDSSRSSRGELLIPLAEDICTRIDIAARRIEVVFPEGLRHLNSAEGA